MDNKTNAVLDTIIDYILYLQNNQNNSGEKLSICFERLIDYVVYELYFEEKVNIIAANILCHLDNLPDIQPLIEKGDTEKPLKIIEKVYQELSASDHPVNMAMARMQEIEEVQIIEGKK